MQAHPHLSRETDYQPIPLSPDGTLDQESLFPESVRGRRAVGAYRSSGEWRVGSGERRRMEFTPHSPPSTPHSIVVKSE